MGIERDDPAAAGQVDPLHPGVWSLIASAVASAQAAGKPVSVCGEMAADPLGALALSALGVDALSVAVNQYTATRQALAAVRVGELDDLRSRLLHQRSARAVRALLGGVS
jgi:phosphoenolpyruvate-protein kinase (PTS system EI component)